jgi:hypothetical protein
VREVRAGVGEVDVVGHEVDRAFGVGERAQGVALADPDSNMCAKMG